MLNPRTMWAFGGLAAMTVGAWGLGGWWAALITFGAWLTAAAVIDAILENT